MGLLKIGSPMSWDDAKKYKEYVKKHGSMQFLANYLKNKDRVDTCFRWGDEVEYFVVNFDHERERVTLSLRAPDIIQQANQAAVAEGENQDEHHTPHEPLALWYPEFGRFMIEGTPGQPYSNRIIHYWAVEENMVMRRHLVEQSLLPNESLMTICAFPTMGVGKFTTPPYTIDMHRNSASRSIFVPDEIISPHLRFSTLARNIRHRRGKKVAINIPVFMDENTDAIVIEKLNRGNAAGVDGGGGGGDGDGGSIGIARVQETATQTVKASTDGIYSADGPLATEDPHPALPNSVYMDAMAFGMGSCCLQCTFQACNMMQARHLYDQLTPLAPIMMALSAATPIYRGVLVDCDVRWPVIESSVDDRTDEEIAAGISKSRYSTTSMYISEGKLGPLNRSDLNDVPVPVNESVRQRLLEGGVDALLAQHVGHLFVRDPIVIFDDMKEGADAEAAFALEGTRRGKKGKGKDKCKDCYSPSDPGAPDVTATATATERADGEDVDHDSSTPPVPTQNFLSTEHFDNVQSTNWNTVRFKPPSADGVAGWRVEFRTMELGMTDFVNAAHSVFVALLVRLIIHSKCNFYMPMSKVDMNSRVAWRRDALHKEKFFFPKHVCRELESRCRFTGSKFNCKTEAEMNAVGLYTINEIVNGCSSFAGLVPLIRLLLDEEESLHKISAFERPVIDAYLNLISDRASGKLVNVATWMRQFVLKHPAYRHDSIVSEKIAYDMVRTMDEISKGKRDAPELFGTHPHARDKNVIELHAHLSTFGDDEQTGDHSHAHQADPAQHLKIIARARRGLRIASEG